MFGFLKNFLGRPVAAQNQARVDEAATIEVSGASESTALAQPTPVRKNGHQNGTGIQVPLKSILATLPSELQTHVMQPEVGDIAIQIPLEKVLAQLSKGAVKMTFGELRHSCPQVFSSQQDRDAVLVHLPLVEILTRLNPALIARRKVQRQVQVPEEISSPFDPNRRTLVTTPPDVEPKPVKPALPTFKPAEAAPAVASAQPVAPISQLRIKRSALTPAPVPAPPPAPSLRLPTIVPEARP